MTHEASYERVAVVIPCYDEAKTVGEVVRGFRRCLPGARIVVCDNNSHDDTAAVARRAGAAVIVERHRGKGFAVRRLFADVDADYFILVDGDGTYTPEVAPEIVRLMREEGVDTVLATRHAVSAGGTDEYRSGHQLGNRIFTRTFSFLFDTDYTDVLTGYRGFSRRFVKSCPLLARGFEVEIELNVHGASLGMPFAEIETPYVERTEGSESKLNTYRDGIRIFRRLFRLFRDFRPALSFGGLGVVLGMVGLGLLIPIYLTYQRTHLVPRFPTLFGVVGLFLAALFLVLFGSILERASRDRLERNRLAYLSVPGPWQTARPFDVTAQGNFVDSGLPSVAPIGSPKASVMPTGATRHGRRTPRGGY